MISAEPALLDFDDFVAYTEKHPDATFELIHGVIYQLAPEGDLHFRTRNGVFKLLLSLVDPTRYSVLGEGSVPAPNWAEGPKPDVFIARGPDIIDGEYAPRPKTDDVLLMIEVSSSTRKKDIERAILYASLSIPEYWMIDLESGVIGVYREPIVAGAVDSAYRSFESYGRDQTITSSAIDSLTVETNDLLRPMSKE